MMDAAEAKFCFKLIMEAWENEHSFGDIYNMIIVWLETYYSLIKNKQVANALLERASTGDELKTIVEDFIYGDCCKLLRKEFS